MEPPRLPKIARAAAIVCFILAAGAVWSSFTTGPILVLAGAPILIAAGIGILRRNIWSAYGLALFTIAETVLVLIAWSRDRFSSADAEGAAGLLFNLAGAGFFLYTGRALARSGSAVRGTAAPWIAIATLMTVPLFFFAPFAIPTGSMEDTLLVGDSLFVQRWPIGTPRRGDLAAFRYPPDPRQMYIKRVVGIPGDRIRIVQKRLYVNGAALTEAYALHETDYNDTYRDNFPGVPNIPIGPSGLDMLQNHVAGGTVVVPGGNYFVMGDNRDASLDSRYYGFVPAENIIGKPVLIYWSRGLGQDSKSTPGPIRWNRIFRLL
jgi:signal peptidase I